MIVACLQGSQLGQTAEYVVCIAPSSTMEVASRRKLPGQYQLGLSMPCV